MAPNGHQFPDIIRVTPAPPAPSPTQLHPSAEGLRSARRGHPVAPPAPLPPTSRPRHHAAGTGSTHGCRSTPPPTLHPPLAPCSPPGASPGRSVPLSPYRPALSDAARRRRGTPAGSPAVFRSSNNSGLRAPSPALPRSGLRSAPPASNRHHRRAAGRAGPPGRARLSPRLFVKRPSGRPGELRLARFVPSRAIPPIAQDAARFERPQIREDAPIACRACR